MKTFGMLLVGILLLSACGGRSNDRAATIPTPVVTPTTIPTAAPTVAVTSASTVAATSTKAASISVANPVPTPVPTATTEIKGLPSKDDLTKLVLTLSDMPTGWTTRDSSDDSSGSSSLCGADTDSGLVQVRTSVDYQKAELGPFFTETLGAFKDGDAQAWMKQFKSKFTCTEDTEVDDQGTPTTFHYSPLSFPNLGDETFAIRMTTDAGILGEADIDAVYVRVGNYIIGTVNLGIGSVDSDLTQSLTQKAVDKVQGK